jgi:hypothetical protein
MKTRKRKMSQIVKTTLKKRKRTINSRDNVRKRKRLPTT